MQKSIVQGVIILLLIYSFVFLFIYLFIYKCHTDLLSIDFSFHATTMTGSDMMRLLRLEQEWSTANGNTITKANGLHVPSQPSVLM